MTQRVMAPGHDLVRESDHEWTNVCQPLATIFDAVMPTDRKALAALLEMMRTSTYRREGRTVIRLLRVANDPLSDLGTLARNALRSWVQLRRLSEARIWSHPAEVLDTPRATALLHLATAVAEGDLVPLGLRTAGYEALVERLTVAAELERKDRRIDIERTLRIRAHTFPDLFPWLDRWLER